MKNLNVVALPKDCLRAVKQWSPTKMETQKWQKEFKAWIARKLNEIQDKVENWHKETSKASQEIREERISLKINQWELRSLKNSLKEFQNTIESFINRLDQAEETVSEIEDWSFKLT